MKYPLYMISVFLAHPSLILILCFSANYRHHESEMDPGTDGEDKEASASGWRVWHLQDCHHSQLP